MINFGTFVDIWLIQQGNSSGGPITEIPMVFEDDTPMLFEDGSPMNYE